MVTLSKDLLKKYAKMMEEEENGNFLIPNGYYDVVIIEIYMNPYKHIPDKHMLCITFEVIDDECRGKRIYVNYNIEHPNSAIANKIGHYELIRLMRAAGIRLVDFDDYNMLLGETLTVKVGSEKNDGYPEKNVIKEYVAQNTSKELSNGKDSGDKFTW